MFYFTTKPLIGGREEKIKKNIYTRPSTVFTNELKQKILSYGKKIKVIKPTWFKEQIEDEIKGMTQNYNNSCVECSNEDHDSDANHCKFCGSRLD